MILGVCSWLAQETGIQVGLMRLIFVIGFLVGGIGLGVYFILWLVKVFIA